MRRACSRTACLVPLAALLAVPALAGGPVDLRDARPRPIAVRFESSPADAPGSLRAAWGEPARAWLAPVAETGAVQIRVDAAAMERVLREYDPVPGSFSEFVWQLDPGTGHVLSAHLTGKLRRRVGLGPWSPRVETGIQIEMDTSRASGFLPGVERFGHRIFEHCDGTRSGCTLVAPRSYDPTDGYVNAVGVLRAHSLGWMQVTSFSPLGEALLHEWDDEAARASAGPELR